MSDEEDRFRRALEVFSEVDCQGEPSDIGIWCVGCIATNVLNGSTIDGEIKASSAHLRGRAKAIEIAERFGGIDGAHHKQWVIDQMLQELLGPRYATWLAERNADDDYAPWDPGIAP